jgi:hypothetical protein
LLCFDDVPDDMPCDVSWVPSRPGYRERCIQLERPGHFLAGKLCVIVCAYVVCLLLFVSIVCILFIFISMRIFIYLFIYLYYLGCVNLDIKLDAG